MVLVEAWIRWGAGACVSACLRREHLGCVSIRAAVLCASFGAVCASGVVGVCAVCMCVCGVSGVPCDCARAGSHVSHVSHVVCVTCLFRARCQVCIECRMSAGCLTGEDVMSAHVIVTWSVKVSGFLGVRGRGQDPACRRSPERQSRQAGLGRDESDPQGRRLSSPPRAHSSMSPKWPQSHRRQPRPQSEGWGSAHPPFPGFSVSPWGQRPAWKVWSRGQQAFTGSGGAGATGGLTGSVSKADQG